MQKLKLGFIGGGINSAIGRTHLIASQMDGRYELVAGCFSRNNEVNEESATAYGIEKGRLYATWQDFLNCEYMKIDAVVVLTPTTEHFQIVIEALKKGFFVICEKALVSNLEQMLEIGKVLKKYKGRLSVTYNYLAYPMIREMKSIIQDEDFGKILRINIEMPQESFLKIDNSNNPLLPQSWRRKDEDIPIVYLDLAVHIHSLMNYFCENSLESVVAMEKTFGHLEVIDDVDVLLKYSEDLVSNWWFGKTSIGKRNGLKVSIYGVNKSVEWYQLNPDEIRVNDNKGTILIIDRGSNLNIANLNRFNRFKAGHPTGFIEAFANYYYDVAESMLSDNFEDNQLINNYKVAKEGMEILTLIRESIKNNKWVEFRKP